METHRISFTSLFILVASFSLATSKGHQSGCSVTTDCRTWTHNDCWQPPPKPASATLDLLRPSPGLVNLTYVICPVVSRWNITEETSNVTEVLKEVKLFLDWLCKMPCDNSTATVKRSCIDDKLVEYTNASSMKNTTVIDRDGAAFRFSVDREIERLDRIANQPLNYDEIKQRIDKLASDMGIIMNRTGNKEEGKTGNFTGKSDVISYINDFATQFNNKTNSSIAYLELTASNYEIKLAVEELERIGRSSPIGQMSLISESLSPIYPYPTTDFASEITPTMSVMGTRTSRLEYLVYPSSCFVQKSHCLMRTECPNNIASPTASEEGRSMMSVYREMAASDFQGMSISSSVKNRMRMEISSTRTDSITMMHQQVTVSPTLPAVPDYCIYDCAGTCNGTKKVDCQTICGGNATVDDCGRCTEGTTGKNKNYLKDCAGVCNGRSLLDSCNVCEQPSSSRGNTSRHQDCNNVCFGDAVVDRCGQCVGGNTGRQPAVPDACGVYCNGDNSTCSGCDNVPNSGKVIDACGICGGSGTTCTVATTAVPTLVTNAGRNVTVLGAGLNGTSVQCVINSAATVTGYINNVTSVICPIPAAPASTESMQVHILLTKSGRVHNISLPVFLRYYDASALSLEAVLPSEQMKGHITDINIHGTGFQNTSLNRCRMYNSSLGDIQAICYNQTMCMCSLPRDMKPGRYGVSLLVNGFVSLSSEISRIVSFEVFAPPPRIKKAKFSNSGSQIIITFTSVRPLITDCNAIFTSNVSSSFGLSPECNWIGNTELRITMGQNASILPGHSLVIKENVFYSLEYSKAAVGSVVVNGPDVPLLTNPVLKGPSMISSCSNLKLSAAQSTGSGGRPMTFAWTVASTASIGSALDNLLKSSSTDSIVIHRSDIIANVDYTFTVSTSNFLTAGSPKTVSITIKKASSPIPDLSIVPSSDPSKVLLASDFFLTAVVAASSCSSNYTAGYIWTTTDASLSSSSPFKTSATKQTLMIGKGTLVGGKSYMIKLKVYWKEDTSIASETSITVQPMLRPLTAVIKGGDFSVGSDSGNFILDAKSLSFDPDNVEQSFRFTWKCIDKTTNGNCISQTERQPLAIASEGVVSINPNELKQRSYEFTVNITSLSTNRWKTAKATVTIKAGTIPVVIINAVSDKVKPNSKLSVKATVIVRSQATAVWSTDVSSPGSSSLDFSDENNFITQPTFVYHASSNSSAYFVLKSGAMQPGAKYTLRLTVNDGTKEGFGQISFEVYNTPTPGEFTVNPMTVEALNRISLTAPLWTMASDCLPLKYEFGNYEEGNRFTSYGVLSDPSLKIPASPGYGSSHQLPLAVRVHSACGTMTEKKLNITSTRPANISEAEVNFGIGVIAEATASGDLSSAVASLDSLLGVASGQGESSVLKKVEQQTLSTVLSLSKSLPKTGSVSSSLLGVLKKVDPNKLNTTKDLSDISEAYEKVLDGLESTAINSNDVQTILDRLADIDKKAKSKNVSESVLRSDKSLAKSLTSKTGPSQLPFETTGKSKRVSIKVAYTMLDKPMKSKSAADAVQIDFGTELKNQFKSWRCSNGRVCEGVFLKMRSYSQVPESLSDSSIVISSTQVVDIALQDPISEQDIAITSLTVPLSFNMTVTNRQPGYSVKCVYYNEASKVWEDRGMTTTISSENVIVCKATHLTSFAVIQVPDAATTTASAVTPTPSASLAFDTFIASFTLANEVWNASLSNASSAEAQTLKASVQQWVNTVFQGDGNYNGISDMSFSLVPVNKVKVKVHLLFKSGGTNNANIESKLKTGSGSNGFHIDVSSISVEKSQTSVQPTSTPAKSEGSSAVLLATIFGVLGAILVVVVIILVVKSLQNKSKVHSQGSAETASP